MARLDPGIPLDFQAWAPHPADHAQRDREYALFRALQRKSDELPDGVVLGAVVRFTTTEWARRRDTDPHAEVYAYYLVVAEEPLALQWIPLGEERLRLGEKEVGVITRQLVEQQLRRRREARPKPAKSDATKAERFIRRPGRGWRGQ
jgi:hypothetical protein